MNFKQEILKYENEKYNDVYLLKIGEVPVILTAVHTMQQFKEDGTLKLKEPYTKAICRYISYKLNTSCFIKVKDNGIDSNLLEIEEFKTELLKIIKDNNIRLLIDLHGAKGDRDFDVEFGTLNNLSVDYSTINELKDSFYEHDIKNIKINDPFKGGGITQYIYSETDIDIIQIEISKRFREIGDIDKLERVCDSIIEFIKMYSNFN